MQRLARFLGDDSASLLRVTLLRRSLGLFGLVLVAATWRLWTPQDAFPQVPFIAAAGNLPDWCQWLGLAGMLAGLGGAMLAPSGPTATVSLVLSAASTAAMIVADQERLQPWAYQFMLVSLVLAWAEPRGAIVLLRLLIASSYLHSGITKLDHGFLHTLGRQFLAALVGLAGGSLEGWNEPALLAAAAVFPVGEIMVAGGLLFCRTRRVALIGAVALHVLLLVILGPWGLGHKPAVLVWNVYFIVQDLLLFWKPRAAGAESREPAGFSPVAAPWPLVVMIVAAIVLPLAAPWAWFDLWPSWGLYAASAERVRLQVHRAAEHQLPDKLHAFLEASSDANDPWLTLRIDRWALDALGAPIYPQNRVQLGVAEAVVSQYGLGNRARVVRFDMANPFTGERRYAVFRGPLQAAAAADEYLLNAHGRHNVQ